LLKKIFPRFPCAAGYFDGFGIGPDPPRRPVETGAGLRRNLYPFI
jgi:hypothetical protein